MKNLLLVVGLLVCALFSTAWADSPYADTQHRRGVSSFQPKIQIKTTETVQRDLKVPTFPGIKTSPLLKRYATGFGHLDIGTVEVKKPIYKKRTFLSGPHKIPKTHNVVMGWIVKKKKIIQDFGEGAPACNPESAQYGIDNSSEKADGVAPTYADCVKYLAAPPLSEKNTKGYHDRFKLLWNSAVLVCNAYGDWKICDITDWGLSAKVQKMGHNWDECYATHKYLKGDGVRYVQYLYNYHLDPSHPRKHYPTAWPWVKKAYHKVLVAMINR